MPKDLFLPTLLSVEKLSKTFSFLHCGIWHGLESSITLKEVEDNLNKDNSALPSVPYSFPIWEHFEESVFRSFHAGRIAYLVKNKAKDPIYIDVGIPSMGHCPSWPIEDGNHRLSAAIVRGDDTILVTFGGAESEIKRFIKEYGPKAPARRKKLTKPALNPHNNLSARS